MALGSVHMARNASPNGPESAPSDVDIIVTNHALLAIDALEGVPVLPDHDVVVVDEGHELAARVTSIATADLSPGLVERAANRSRAFVESVVFDELVEGGEILRRVLVEVEPGRLDVLPDGLSAAVRAVRDAARTVQSGFATGAGADREPDVEAGRRAAKAMVDEIFGTAERMTVHAESDVVWVEDQDRGPRRLRIAPLSVAALLRDRLFGPSTVVATSATMQLGGSFDAIAKSLGLAGEEAPAYRGLDVGSPFDYGKQAILYVARDLPPPGRDGLRPAALDALAELMTAAGGRTLGLFSSRRAAEEAAADVRARAPDLPVLCQGEDVVATLVRRFAEEEQTSLFGTLSLWQGVDVPGGACQLVVIDRVPFPRPDDPLHSARQLAVERMGGNGFMSVAATHAALLLAQGAGRLIRRASDRGVVAVLDPRLVRARYGAFLRASLPPMWFTTDRQVVLAALQRLAELPALSVPQALTSSLLFIDDRPLIPTLLAGGLYSNPSHHCDDAAENRRLGAVDRIVGGVVGHQPHLVVAPSIGLDRRLALDHRGDDLAILGNRLLPHDNPVTVADGDVDHRIAGDAQHEQRAFADELAGEREDILDGLFGEHRPTSRDAAHNGHVRRRRTLIAIGLVDLRYGPKLTRVEHFERSRQVGVTADVALRLERMKLMGDARRAGQPGRLADLAHRRRIPTTLERVANDLEHAALARGESFGILRRVGEGVDRAARLRVLSALPAHTGLLWPCRVVIAGFGEFCRLRR